MKPVIAVVAAIPPLAVLVGPLVPAIRAPELFLGFPRLLVWTVFWGILACTVAMLVVDRTGGAEPDEEEQP